MILDHFILINRKTAEEDKGDTENNSMTLGQGCRILIKNKSYMLLGGAYTFLYGIYTSMGAIISYMTAPYFDPMYNSVFAPVFIICGVISSFIIGIALGKFRIYE